MQTRRQITRRLRTAIMVTVVPCLEILYFCGERFIWHTEEDDLAVTGAVAFAMFILLGFLLLTQVLPACLKLKKMPEEGGWIRTGVLILSVEGPNPDHPDLEIKNVFSQGLPIPSHVPIKWARVTIQSGEDYADVNRDDKRIWISMKLGWRKMKGLMIAVRYEMWDMRSEEE